MILKMSSRPKKLLLIVPKPWLDDGWRSLLVFVCSYPDLALQIFIPPEPKKVFIQEEGKRRNLFILLSWEFYTSLFIISHKTSSQSYSIISHTKHHKSWYLATNKWWPNHAFKRVSIPMIYPYKWSSFHNCEYSITHTWSSGYYCCCNAKKNILGLEPDPGLVANDIIG